MILAMDYGTKNIGMAVSDENNNFAFAINKLLYKNDNKLIEDLKIIINKYNTSKLIIGLPLGIDNKPTKMSKRVKSFTALLIKNVKIEVEFWDETMSSVLAKINSFSNKGIDSESARIILQEFLDHKNI